MFACQLAIKLGITLGAVDALPEREVQRWKRFFRWEHIQHENARTKSEHQRRADELAERAKRGGKG